MTRVAWFYLAVQVTMKLNEVHGRRFSCSQTNRGHLSLLSMKPTVGLSIVALPDCFMRHAESTMSKRLLLVVVNSLVGYQSD